MATGPIDYSIHGDDLQILEVVLEPGAAVRGEIGSMIYMGEGIEMQTSTGGLFSGLKRMFTGESFFITSFLNDGAEPAVIAFSAPYPGKIIALDLGALDGSFLCERGAFLCAAQGVEIEVEFTKRLGAGFFGGEGFMLQRLEGDGVAFAHAGGTVVRRDLGEREKLRIDTGCLVALAPSVDYDIEFIGGFRNALFGGEGVFLATLTGPGSIYLQSLPFSRLVDRLAAAMPPSERGDAG